MHELGIVMHIIDTVEKLAKEQSLTKISTLTLEIGEVSPVMPDYLVDGWNWAHKRSELLKDTELEVEILPAVTLCEDCGEEYSTTEFAKQCPKCKSENTSLLRGNEFNLKNIRAC